MLGSDDKLDFGEIILLETKPSTDFLKNMRVLNTVTVSIWFHCNTGKINEIDSA